MTVLTDRNNFVTLFAGNWSGISTFYPGEEFEEPTPTGSISSPAAYQILEILYQDAERMTFGGTRIRRGSLVHNLWVERAGSDQKIISAAADAIEVWRSASISGATMFPDDAVLGDPVSDGPWEGRALSIPFWIMEEPGAAGAVLTLPFISAANGAMNARLYNTTVDATPTELFRDGASLRLTIAVGVTASFIAHVLARAASGTAAASYRISGVIQNNAGTVALLGGIHKESIFETTPATYDATVTADDTNDALVVTVTGAGHWEADMQINRSIA